MKKVVCLVGPSGVGKTSCINNLVEKHGFIAPIKITTREKRADDCDNYDYLTPRQFKDLIQEDSLLEWSSFGDHLYGITLESYADARRKDSDVIMDVTIDASEQIQQQIPFARIIAMVPDDPDLLKKRLASRPEVDKSWRLEEAHKMINVIKSISLEAVITVTAESTVDSICEQILRQIN